MEIYDEKELTPLEIERQRNVIKNHEFMKSCGLPVQPLIYVKKEKPEEFTNKLHEYESESSTDSDDSDWYGMSPKKKKEKKNQIVPEFKCKVRKPAKYIGKDEIKPSHLMRKSTVKKQSVIPIRNRKSFKHVEPVHKSDSMEARYPKRSTSRKNYKEDEVPDDDHYIFCEECGEFNIGECSIHEPLIPLADKKAHSEKKSAISSLPDGLEIRESSIPNSGLGVFSTEKFKVGVVFGPYQGKKIQPDICREDFDTSYMWEVMKDGRVAYYIDGKDEEYSNWMRFINCSRVEKEQNLVAFQYHREIYYRTYKEISIGDELLVWYGDEYASDLGININEDEAPKNNQILNCQSKKRKKSIKIEPDGLFTCERCQKKFLFSALFEIHLKKSFCSERNFRKCGKMKVKDKIGIGNAKNEMSMKRKSKDFDNNDKRPFQCSLCSYYSNWKHSLNRHMLTHTGEKPHKCSLCDYSCAHKSSLNIHMLTHTGEKPYKCSICDYSFTVKSNLNQHMLTHTGEKPHKCSICDHSFTVKSNLNQHMLTHTGEKPHKCSICDYSFTVKSNLNQHMLTHSGEKPHKCSICDYSCTQKCHLNKHMLTHTGEKPHKCSICDYCCAHKISLNKHMLTHTGEKPHKCSLCDYSCAVKSSLNRHMLTHARKKIQ